MLVLEQERTPVRQIIRPMEPIHVDSCLTGRSVRTAVHATLQQAVSLVEGAFLVQGRSCGVCGFGREAWKLHLPVSGTVLGITATGQAGCSHVANSAPRQLIVATASMGQLDAKEQQSLTIILETVRRLLDYQLRHRAKAHNHPAKGQRKRRRMRAQTRVSG